MSIRLNDLSFPFDVSLRRIHRLTGRTSRYKYIFDIWLEGKLIQREKVLEAKNTKHLLSQLREDMMAFIYRSLKNKKNKW